MKGVKVQEIAAGAVLSPDQVLVSKDCRSRPGCRQKS